MRSGGRTLSSIEFNHMAVLEEYRFEIPGFIPETMPLDRLLVYLNQVAVLLGDPNELHLVRIEKASTQPVLAMPRAVGLKARKRVDELRAGGGSERRRNAFKVLQRMVGEDGGGPARLIAPEGATILKFEPSDESGAALHAIRQETAVQGTLMRVGGTQESSTVLLQTDDGEVISGCYANRTLAKELAAHLYEPVRLSGVGTWSRATDGRWSLERMQVQSFYPLDDKPLNDVIRELQAIPVDWPHETLQRLRDLRSNT